MADFQNVYEQVDKNKRKSLGLIIGFILFISLVGYAFTYIYGYDWSYLVFALGFSSIGSYVSYYHSDKIALTLSGAKEVDPRRYPEYKSAIENISRVANIPTPKIYVIPSSSLNAFATGRDPDHAAVAVTQGLLDKLSRTELEGVVAHEVAHIANYDTRLMTLVAVLVGSIAIIIDWSFRFGIGGARRDRKEGGGILMVIGILTIILAPLIANLIKLAISRRREFFADAQATKYTRQPSGLIGALEKISGSPPMARASHATAHMYIENPFGKKKNGQWLNNLFSTHPPVEERIKALKGGIE